MGTTSSDAYLRSRALCNSTMATGSWPDSNNSLPNRNRASGFSGFFCKTFLSWIVADLKSRFARKPLTESSVASGASRPQLARAKTHARAKIAGALPPANMQTMPFIRSLPESPPSLVAPKLLPRCGMISFDRQPCFQTGVRLAWDARASNRLRAVRVTRTQSELSSRTQLFPARRMSFFG